MLFQSKTSQRRHWFWGRVFLVATTLATLWYVWSWWRTGQMLGGGSGTGLLFGSLAALIIGFEMWLWVQKWRWLRSILATIRVRLGKTSNLMAAHIWLGLLCVPLVVMHTGGRLGGRLTTVLAVLFIVVIASGLYGLWLQNILPRQMKMQTSGETIFSQIDWVAGSYVEAAEQLVLAVCGPPPDSFASGELVRRTAVPSESSTGLSDSPGRPEERVRVGAQRSWSNARNPVHDTEEIPREYVMDSEPLRGAFQSDIETYLRQGDAGTTSRLSNLKQADEFFRDLRDRLSESAHPAVNALQKWCNDRREFDLQKNLHFHLHAWLLVHLPLSLALVVLLVVHIWTGICYW